MAVQRFVGSRYFGLSTDIKPTVGVNNGSTFVEGDTSKIYFFSGGWQDSIGNAAVSGFSGASGASGYVNTRKDYIVTTAPTGRRTPITLPNNGYVSGNAENFLVFTEGTMLQRDSLSGLYDNDYTIYNSGNGTTPGQVAFSFAIPASLMITFKYLYIFLILSVIII